MIQQEKRSLRRYAAPTSLEATAKFPTKGEERIHIKDMGLDGFCFTVEIDISGESLFDLSLSSGEGSGPSLDIKTSAKIIWHIHEEATSLHTVGAGFVEPAAADSDLLRRYIAFLASRQSEGQPPSIESDGSGS